MSNNILHRTAAQRWFTVQAAAQHFGVGTMTVYREINRGNLKASRFGNRILIHLDEILDYPRRNQVQVGDFDGWSDHGPTPTERKKREKKAA